MDKTVYKTYKNPTDNPWNRLSIADKAAMMEVAVRNGITTLPEIREAYNVFTEGGDLSDDDLVDWIIKEEGFNTKPEDIGDGKMTLGSGLTNPKWHELYRQRGNVWSQEDNRMAVAEEVADRRKWAEQNVPNWDTLPESAQKALLSYKYNYNFTRNNSPKLYAALESNNLEEAARQMNATSKDPKFVEGLTQRRQREQQWFLSDVIPHTPTVKTYSDTIPGKEQAVSTRVVNPYQGRVQQMPVKVPKEGSYIETVTLSPSEVRVERMKKAMQDQAAYNRLMNSVRIQNNPRPQFVPKNRFDKGGTKKQAFLSSLDQSLKEDNRFDNAQWRQFFTDLADMESGYSSNITNSIGAKGYFQLMPFNRAKTWNNPTQQFHEMYKLTGNNLDYLNKNLTKKDWEKADALGIDMYGMLAGAHLGGAGNVLKALRGKGNAKDMNGTSVMKYMTKFSQKGSVPTLATPTYYEDAPAALFTPSNPGVFFGGYKAPEIDTPLPSLVLDDTPQYSEEEIARQERKERLNNLNMLFKLTSPQGSSNSMLDAIGLLMG